VNISALKYASKFRTSNQHPCLKYGKHQSTITLYNTVQKRTLFLFVSHQEVLSVWRHVELQWKREVRVYFFFHHGHHVEGIAHCVETKDARKNLETSPTQMDDKSGREYYERLELSPLSTTPHSSCPLH